MTKEQLNKAKKQFKNHRQGAARRNIEFCLTFEQWLTIWLLSGHYENRGNKKGQYVMCRKGDLGPYAINNVFIDTNTNNIRDAWLGRKRGPQTQEHKDKVNVYKVGRKQSPETIAKRVSKTTETKNNKYNTNSVVTHN